MDFDWMMAGIAAGFFYTPTRFLYCIVIASVFWRFVFIEFNKQHPPTWFDGKQDAADYVYGAIWFAAIVLSESPFLMMFL